MKFRIQNLLDEELTIEQETGTECLNQTLGTTAKIDVKWDLQ